MNPFKFKIPTRKRKCSSCETSFVDNTSIFSVIKGDEEDPQREDYCAECFQKEAGITENSWGFWETLLKKPKVKLTLDQRAMELFTEKHESEEKEWVYFIADYLKRKKQLIKRAEIKKEGVIFFEDPITSEIYSIADVSISPESLSTLKASFLKALEEPGVEH